MDVTHQGKCVVGWRVFPLGEFPFQIHFYRHPPVAVVDICPEASRLPQLQVSLIGSRLVINNPRKRA
jgi:hypothetical protein